MRSFSRDLTKTLLLAVVYFAAAKIGLRLATVTSSITLVWPPTGIALAALLLLGRRAWPGVALGAFAGNLSTPGVTAPIAIGVAAGNTLEALLGAYLLERSRFDRSLDRIGDVVRLLVLAGGVSTLASATIGVATLWAGGHVPSGALGRAWLMWWVGDLMGNLVFAPLLLTLTRGLAPSETLRSTIATATRPRSVVRGAELVAWASGLLVVSLSAFGVRRWVSDMDFPQAFAIFPLLVGAALRFGPRGAAAANVVVSVISVGATANGLGPFARGTLNESLLQLQTFMAMAVLTSLVLGASVAERDRAIALRDDFLSIASHELRTPLTALHLDVVSLGRMLERGDAPEEKLRHRVAHTERQLERLNALVNQLLDSSQIAAGRFTLTLTNTDLTDVAREVAQRFADDGDGEASRIEIDAPGPVGGLWDPVRLELVVANLLANAIKYGAKKPITVTVTANETEATLSVQDRGIGIDPADHARVFARFERAVSRTNYAGLGLGLWISKALVEAMDGRIELTSALGAGSTFRVTLPRRR